MKHIDLRLKNFKSNKRKNLKKHFLFDIKGVGPKTVQKIYQKYTSLRSLARLPDLKISKDLNIKLELAKEIQSLIKELYN